MKLVINASTCVVGGGVQVTVNLVKEIMATVPVQACVVLASAAVADQIPETREDGPVRTVRIHPSPARLFGGVRSRRFVTQLVNDFNPSMVFTVFGPSYQRFDYPHLMGFADPFLIVRNSVALRNHGLMDRLRLEAKVKAKRICLRWADEHVVETEAARHGLARVLQRPIDFIHVVPNNCSSIFWDAAALATPRPFRCQPGVFQVLCMGAPYPHKNFQIVPQVAARLKQLDPSNRYFFKFTIPSDHPLWCRLVAEAEQLGVSDNLSTVGATPLANCPKLYREADAVLHPSLLEVFSATYVEAAVMGRPVVATDLDFAREALGEAGRYYFPLNAGEAAHRLAELALCESLYRAAVLSTRERSKSFQPPQEKYRLQIALMNDFCRRRSRGRQECRNQSQRSYR